MKTASQTDTFDHTIGSGCFQFSWWLGLFQVKGEGPDWEFTVRAGEQGDETTGVLNHKTVMKAARQIIASRPRYASDALVRECRNLIFDADQCDFDACSADELVQFIIFDEIVYG